MSDLTLGSQVYRYEDSYDGYTSSYIHLCIYTITRRTRACAYIKLWSGEKRILISAKKKYAYPTKEEALVSLEKRREKQIGILKAQIEKAEAGFRAAKNFNLADPNHNKKDFPGMRDNAYYEIKDNEWL
jgi:hypothetical protein